MAKKKIIAEDTSTEEKIMQAARKLFTLHGYDAVKTRDIAAEAGINLALLNYYFRSKEKLFDLIMTENMQEFMQGIVIILNNPETSATEKLDRLADSYIDMMLRNPNLPLFVLTELKKHPERFASKLDKEVSPSRSVFAQQMQETLGGKKVKPLHMLHLFANLMGLLIFPFVGAPMLKRAASVNQEEFNKLMLERKKLIPQWIKAMMLTELK